MEHPTPYGMRDIKLTAFTDQAGTILAEESVDLPVARTLSWTESEDFSELRGDDRVVAQHGSGPTVSFDLESGGMPFEAFQVMAGGTIEESGSGNTAKKVYSKKSTDARPWFRIEGQAISDSGGDVHTIIHKAKCTGDLSGEFTDGDFHLLSASGVGIGDSDDNLYSFVQNAVATAFEEPNASLLPKITAAGPAGQGEGDTLLLTGVRFTGVTGITIGGVAGTSVTLHDDGHVSFDLPAGSAGAANIIVTTGAGASVAFSYTRTV